MHTDPINDLANVTARMCEYPESQRRARPSDWRKQLAYVQRLAMSRSFWHERGVLAVG
jgi:hypothetical protein